MKPPSSSKPGLIAGGSAPKGKNSSSAINNSTNNRLPHSASASSELSSSSSSVTRPERLSPIPSTLKQQLLNSGGPGNYLSRSQDSLYGSTSVNSSMTRRKGSTPGLAAPPTGVKGRPQSSLGLPKTSPCGSVARTAPTTPVNVGSIPGAGKVSSSAQSAGPKQRKTASQQADARITKTKVTVTELEKARQELETQLSDLTKKADSRQAEIAQLKIELRRAKEAASETEKLKIENERLKNTVMQMRETECEKSTSFLFGSDCGSPIFASCGGVDVATSPLPNRRAVNDPGSGSEDQFQGADNDNEIPDAPMPEWDRQSTGSQYSEVSVACLQDRIAFMEETHYSTSEELQATLQELTDLQEIVHEIAKENQQLSEENKTFSDTFRAQNAKMDQFRLQIENLKHLVLSSGEFRSSALSGGERDQKLIELLKATHEDHEDLKCKFVEIHAALGVAQEELGQRAEMVGVLKDRNRILELQVESIGQDRKNLEEQVSQLRDDNEKDKREIHRLSLLNEKERCKVEELQRQTEASTKGELESLLEFVRKEKDGAEERCNQLEEALAIQKHERDKDNDHKETLIKDLNSAEETALALSKKVQEIDRNLERMKHEHRELQVSLKEAEERCERHLEDKKEYKANSLTMQEHIEELRAENDKLRKELMENREMATEREEEWKQFQADLQVAVKVANDFKMEAQTDMERLSEENTELKDKIGILSTDLDRIKKKTSVHTSPVKYRATTSVTTTGQSPEIRNRVDEYMRMAQTGVESKSPVVMRRNNLETKGLSVKDLIETMEQQKTGSPPGLESPIVTLRDRSPLMRSPGSSRHTLATTSPNFPPPPPNRLGLVGLNTAGTTAATEATPGGGFSKSSTSLANTSPNVRPASLDSVSDLLKGTARQKKTQVLVSVAESSPGEKMRLTDQKSPSDGAQGIRGIEDTPLASRPRGILVQKTPSPSVTAQKKAVYLDENKDPLAKLMKDAPRGSRRNALLKWCQTRTLGYKNVEITNFSSSWNDGFAFCALIHSFLPDQIPISDLLESKDKRKNFTLAFEAAQKAGVSPSLSVDEMVSLERPNWSSVMAYVTDIYQFFESG